MSPKAELVLWGNVRPIIRATLARGAVKTVGAEDLQECEADGVTMAANMIDAAEKAGRGERPHGRGKGEG